FGKVTAVDGIDMTIAEGEFFSMLGPSGSGKTTVLRMIAGFEQPSGGSVWLEGRDVTRQAPFERGVNTVFQDYALFPHMSVLDNVAYGLQVRRGCRGEGAAEGDGGEAAGNGRGGAGQGPDAGLRGSQADAAVRRAAAAGRTRPCTRRPAQGAVAGRAARGARPEAAGGDAGRAEGVAETGRD